MICNAYCESQGSARDHFERVKSEGVTSRLIVHLLRIVVGDGVEDEELGVAGRPLLVIVVLLTIVNIFVVDVL